MKNVRPWYERTLGSPTVTPLSIREAMQAEITELRSLKTLDPMTRVADEYAHRLALELECVLADRPRYYDGAMQVLSEYRSAMNNIHEEQCQTFMGEFI